MPEDEQELSFETAPKIIYIPPEIESVPDVLEDDDEFLIIYHSSRLLV